MNKKHILLAVIVIIIIGSIFYLESQKAGPSNISSTSEPENTQVETEEVLEEGEYPRAPELRGISGYLNTNGEEIKISDFKGKVVMIDFWTYTCINCIRTLPILTGWDEKYRDRGLVIIGVHTPEFNFEKKEENVLDAMEKYDIEYRVVQDNDYATWQAYQNRFWPRKYLIDAEGFIRYDHIGEGGYTETEEKIQELLAEIGEDTSELNTIFEGERVFLPRTPELYAGYEFALPRFQTIGNPIGFQLDKEHEYFIEDKNKIRANAIYLEGLWKSNPDNLEFAGEEGSIVLDFTAGEVNIVADSLHESESLEMEVFLEGNYISKKQAGQDVQFEGNRAFVVVDKPQLYNVYKGKHGSFKLELKLKDDFNFNAFTFG